MTASPDRAGLLREAIVDAISDLDVIVEMVELVPIRGL